MLGTKFFNGYFDRSAGHQKIGMMDRLSRFRGFEGGPAGDDIPRIQGMKLAYETDRSGVMVKPGSPSAWMVSASSRPSTVPARL